MLRTTLTCLIIAFGIMALVGILTAVDGIQAALTNNFATMGANNFDIRRKGSGIQGNGPRRPGNNTFEPITIEQAQLFKERFIFPSVVSLSMFGAMNVTLKYGSEKTNPNIQVFGGDENYLSIGGFDLAAGRNFTDTELKAGRPAVIIGNGIAEKLFKNPLKAIDKVLSVNDAKFHVIGVLAEKGASSIFSSDNICIVPLETARAKYSTDNTSYVITVQMGDSYAVETATAEASGLMRTLRQVPFDEEDDFDVSKSDKLSATLIDQSSYVTTAATLIGFITLLGGAIGLMNIMLVSVSERIREIGITKALGAKRSTIITQFLVEAIVICQIGGLLGIGLGILAGNGVSMLLKGPFIIPWVWLIGGIVLCFIVGLISGLYPAYKAANVDPIESLRHE